MSKNAYNVVDLFKQLTTDINEKFDLRFDHFKYNNKEGDTRFLVQFSSDCEKFFLVIYPDYSYKNCAKFDALMLEKNIKICELIMFIKKRIEEEYSQICLKRIRIYPISIIMRKITKDSK